MGMPADPLLQNARFLQSACAQPNTIAYVQQTISMSAGLSTCNAFCSAGLNSAALETRNPAAPNDSAKRTKSGLTRSTAARRPGIGNLAKPRYRSGSDRL